MIIGIAPPKLLPWILLSSLYCDQTFADCVVWIYFKVDYYSIPYNFLWKGYKLFFYVPGLIDYIISTSSIDQIPLWFLGTFALCGRTSMICACGPHLFFGSSVSTIYISFPNISWDKYIVRSFLRHPGWAECEQWAIFYVFAPPPRTRNYTKTFQFHYLYCSTSTQVEDFSLCHRPGLSNLQIPLIPKEWKHSICSRPFSENYTVSHILSEIYISSWLKLIYIFFHLCCA
jgi:hypothetical protein